MSVGIIHHLEIYVSDLQRSIDFWGWFLVELGYSLYQKWDRGQSFKLEETYLVFVQTEERFLDIPYHRCRTGLNHLAFHGGSRQQIDELVEKLKKKGVPILYPDKHPFAGGDEYYAAYFEDPDRIKVELAASVE